MKPRTVRALLRLYPRRWRQHHGPEYAELLASTTATLPVLADVVRYATAVRVSEHRRTTRAAAAIAAFAVLDALAVLAGITDNVLWAPTTPLRAVALAMILAPLAAWGALVATSRRQRPAAR